MEMQNIFISLDTMGKPHMNFETMKNHFSQMTPQLERQINSITDPQERERKLKELSSLKTMNSNLESHQNKALTNARAMVLIKEFTNFLNSIENFLPPEVRKDSTTTKMEEDLKKMDEGIHIVTNTDEQAQQGSQQGSQTTANKGESSQERREAEGSSEETQTQDKTNTEKASNTTDTQNSKSSSGQLPKWATWGLLGLGGLSGIANYILESQKMKKIEEIDKERDEKIDEQRKRLIASDPTNVDQEKKKLEGLLSQKLDDTRSKLLNKSVSLFKKRYEEAKRREDDIGLNIGNFAHSLSSMSNPIRHRSHGLNAALDIQTRKLGNFL
jgi:hypothetical protein